jgi:hypothetical protein
MWENNSLEDVSSIENGDSVTTPSEQLEYQGSNRILVDENMGPKGLEDSLISESEAEAGSQEKANGPPENYAPYSPLSSDRSGSNLDDQREAVSPARPTNNSDSDRSSESSDEHVVYYDLTEEFQGSKFQTKDRLETNKNSQQPESLKAIDSLDFKSAPKKESRPLSKRQLRHSK